MTRTAVRAPTSGSSTIPTDATASYGSSPNGTMARTSANWVVTTHNTT